MILIGSKAASLRGLRFARPLHTNEYDVIGTLEELGRFQKDGFAVKESRFPGLFFLKKDGVVLEFDTTQNTSNELLEEVCDHVEEIEIAGISYWFVLPSRRYLYLTKRAHANFSIHFSKTLSDVVQMQRQWDMRDFVKTPDEQEYYDARHGEAKERYGKIQERIKLNKSNEEFFKAGMNLRTYVHDDLHKAIAFEDKPIYMKCKNDLNSAKIERHLFEELSMANRLFMVMEESMVIGLERVYIPENIKPESAPERKAVMNRVYAQGLQKLTKDLCKGWFQDFIIDNFNRLTTPAWDFIEKFEVALENGKIRKLEDIKE